MKYLRKQQTWWIYYWKFDTHNTMSEEVGYLTTSDIKTYQSACDKFDGWICKELKPEPYKEMNGYFKKHFIFRGKRVHDFIDHMEKMMLMGTERLEIWDTLVELTGFKPDWLKQTKKSMEFADFKEGVLQYIDFFMGFMSKAQNTDYT